MISRQLGPQSPRKPLATHYAVMVKYCSTRKVPLLKEAHVQGCLKFANEHLNDSKEDWETGCGKMRPKSSSLASTRLATFGGGRMLNMTPRTPSPPSSMEVETSCFGAVSLPRVQDDSTTSRGLWMGPCNVEYWACTSFSHC